MSTTNAPFGLRPVYHPSGQIRAYSLAGGITSGYNTAIYQGSPVKFNNGVLNVAAAGDAIVGSFQGVQWADPTTGRTQFSNRWTASMTYVTGSCIASFYRDPGIWYEIQGAATFDQADIGGQVNFTSATIGSGNTTTGMSSATAEHSLQGSFGQLEVMDIAGYADNSWSDPYPVLRVTISLHQDVQQHLAY